MNLKHKFAYTNTYSVCLQCAINCLETTTYTCQSFVYSPSRELCALLSLSSVTDGRIIPSIGDNFYELKPKCKLVSFGICNILINITEHKGTHITKQPQSFIHIHLINRDPSHMNVYTSPVLIWLKYLAKSLWSVAHQLFSLTMYPETFSTVTFLLCSFFPSYVTW